MDLKALIVGVAALSLGVYLLFDAGRRWLRFRKAQWWPGAPGSILEAIVYDDPRRKNMQHFRVIYEFAPDARTTILGETPRLCGDWFWSLKAQAKWVSQYSPGQLVEVFFDPEDPERNCLDRTDTSSFGGQLLVGNLMLLCGTMLLVFFL